MADKVSKEIRSKNMKAIKSISILEGLVSKALWRNGLRFRRNAKDLFGKPDISIKKYKVVIFIDSCFWHYCDIHGRYPKSNEDFWKEKFTRNKRRDNEVTEYYKDKDWNILRIWEHQIKQDFDGTIEDIMDFINSARNLSKR
ncbi:very short patch repair endonuclease [Paenibacillus rhizophilus]|uniref:Very short patch repair endonuclease n=1 Tax=Paenibacillus rhizophilus TaxID=1850366 RepID=A0A3N9NZJ3_9BACL|nr:very short patch repair endonuclease [Paenibacillus rhizophilus]RQW08839.1 very short patch repair endonuclease [Paenibacillus rhizophilus]